MDIYLRAKASAFVFRLIFYKSVSFSALTNLTELSMSKEKKMVDITFKLIPAAE